MRDELKISLIINGNVIPNYIKNYKQFIVVIEFRINLLDFCHEIDLEQGNESWNSNIRRSIHFI